MDLTIRSIAPEELQAFMRTLLHAFHDPELDEHLKAEALIYEPDRYFVALDGERFVGTAGACTTLLTLPGGRAVTAPGVTAVGVLPSHRRRGINTRLMATLLDQAAGRGEPLAYLWASESSIYGRFGYGMAAWCTELAMPTERSEFVGGVRLDGAVRALPREEALPLMRPVYERVAARRPGLIAIDDRWWSWLNLAMKKDEDEPNFYAVHEDEAGTPDGYAVYKVKQQDWEYGVANHELRVQFLFAETPAASAALWRFLLDIDLVSVVKAWDRAVDEELLWLVREPRRLRFTVSDGLWVRLVDVAASLAARGYAGDGRVVFEVEDAFRPATSGRYALEVAGGEGSGERTDAEPDVACDVAALGAAYLGGPSFRQLARAGQVRELVPGALARADAMFASDPAPWFGFLF
jgi:predicted acetyltransferase